MELTDCYRGKEREEKKPHEEKKGVKMSQIGDRPQFANMHFLPLCEDFVLSCFALLAVRYLVPLVLVSCFKHYGNVAIPH